MRRFFGGRDYRATGVGQGGFTVSGGHGIRLSDRSEGEVVSDLLKRRRTPCRGEGFQQELVEWAAVRILMMASRVGSRSFITIVPTLPHANAAAHGSDVAGFRAAPT